MKKVFFIRHAKSRKFLPNESDFERAIAKKGYKQIQTIASYLKLATPKPDMILSSCALRAQQTSIALAKILEYEGKITFLEQLYITAAVDVLDMIALQDDSIEVLYIIGHHPYLTELVNTLTKEHIAKIPTMGVVAIDFAIESWSEISKIKGDLAFFIFPKQFQYYMPKQIQVKLHTTTL